MCVRKCVYVGVIQAPGRFHFNAITTRFDYAKVDAICVPCSKTRANVLSPTWNLGLILLHETHIASTRI